MAAVAVDAVEEEDVVEEVGVEVEAGAADFKKQRGEGY